MWAYIYHMPQWCGSIKAINMGYDDRLQFAAIEATAKYLAGISYCTATEYYAEFYDVTLSDVQEMVDLRLQDA